MRAQIGLPDFDYYKTRSADERRSYRNNYVTTRMYAIDLAYTDYETSLTTGRQTGAFLTDATSIALNATTSLVTPTGTKDILAAVAGGITGVKAAYNDDVLLKSTIQLLQTQMRANRAIVASRILSRLGNGDSEYPLPLALSDLEDYYRAGTITGAMLKAQESASSDEQDAQAARQSVIYYELSNSPGQVALRDALTAGGKVDYGLYQRLEARIGPGLRVDQVLSSPKFAALADTVAREFGYLK